MRLDRGYNRTRFERADRKLRRRFRKLIQKFLRGAEVAPDEMLACGKAVGEQAAHLAG